MAEEMRRVRFRFEWAEELPADAVIEPGYRVRVGSDEMVAREVLLPWGTAGGRTPFQPTWHGNVASDERRGADALVKLGPHLVAPGATWHVQAQLSQRRPVGKRDPTDWAAASLEREAATLGEALDAVLEWAEGWTAVDPPPKAPDGGPPELTGSAELYCDEPGEGTRGLLEVALAPALGHAAPDEVLAALHAFREEAERLYGDVDTDADGNEGMARKTPKPDAPKTRRVRIRVEWVEELPPGVAVEPGYRVRAEGGEMVAREIRLPSGTRRSRVRPTWHGNATGADLRGADELVELGPRLVEPGATWRATASLSVLGTLRKGDPNWRGVSNLERDAAKLGEALDAFPSWAEEWTALDPPLKAPGGGPPKLSGHAELSSVEPGGSEHGRTVLRVFLGEHDAPYDEEGALAALEALCEEAERLYGDAAEGDDVLLDPA